MFVIVNVCSSNVSCARTVTVVCMEPAKDSCKFLIVKAFPLPSGRDAGISNKVLRFLSFNGFYVVSRNESFVAAGVIPSYLSDLVVLTASGQRNIQISEIPVLDTSIISDEMVKDFCFIAELTSSLSPSNQNKCLRDIFCVYEQVKSRFSDCHLKAIRLLCALPLNARDQFFSDKWVLFLSKVVLASDEFGVSASELIDVIEGSVNSSENVNFEDLYANIDAFAVSIIDSGREFDRSSVRAWQRTLPGASPSAFISDSGY